MLRFTWNKINTKVIRSSKNPISLQINVIIFITNSSRYVSWNQWKPCDIKDIEIMVMWEQSIHLRFNLWKLCISWVSQAWVLYHVEVYRCSNTLTKTYGYQMHCWKFTHICNGSICQLCCAVCVESQNSRNQLDYKWKTYE